MNQLESQQEGDFVEMDASPELQAAIAELNELLGKAVTTIKVASEKNNNITPEKAEELYQFLESVALEGNEVQEVDASDEEIIKYINNLSKKVTLSPIHKDSPDLTEEIELLEAHLADLNSGKEESDIDAQLLTINQKKRGSGKRRHSVSVERLVA